MGGFLEIKLVKPTKVVSRPTNEGAFHQFLVSQAKANIWAADTGVLREPNAAVRKELR